RDRDVARSSGTRDRCNLTAEVRDAVDGWESPGRAVVDNNVAQQCVAEVSFRRKRRSLEPERDSRRCRTTRLRADNKSLEEVATVIDVAKGRDGAPRRAIDRPQAGTARLVCLL